MKMGQTVLLFLLIICVGFSGCSVDASEQTDSADNPRGKLDVVPELTRHDAGDEKTVREFLDYYFEQDVFISAIRFDAMNRLYTDGVQPRDVSLDLPDSYEPLGPNLTDWFEVKMIADLNMLRNVSREEFQAFTDEMVLLSDITGYTAAPIGAKYEVDFENFIYDVEMSKIPDGDEKEIFKSNLLADTILIAESRLLSFVFETWYGEKYVAAQREVE